MFAMLLKETRPLRFFGAFSLVFLAASVGMMVPVLADYFATGLVPRMPTWVAAMALALFSMMSLVAGLILDSVARGRAEQKRIFYLSFPATRGDRRRAAREAHHAHPAPAPAKAAPAKAAPTKAA